mmetsp:Transcript_36612/g.85853  ORF Transcript_36612/g.85853 Transcript_36612/m.85853 type:complete len:203 (-) Transcript_36612:102-710(-)
MVENFDTLAQGSYSGISHALEAAMTSKEEWSSFWEKHTSNESPPPALPDVTFGTDMVICVFSGECGTGGHAVEIKRVEASSTSLSVAYETTSPPPGAICTEALTQPHHIVRLKACDLPVTFSCAAAPHPASAGGATFLLTIDAVKKDVATETIQSKAEVFSVKPMFDGEILCVQLDTSSLSVEDAQAMLQCIDGVLSVERDG